MLGVSACCFVLYFETVKANIYPLPITGLSLPKGGLNLLGKRRTLSGMSQTTRWNVVSASLTEYLIAIILII
jgi:hypothetical protein